MKRFLNMEEETNVENDSDDSSEGTESKSIGRYDKEGYKEITMEKPREIDASGIERPWRLDPKGYFLIRVNEELGKIEAAFCDIKENKVRVIIRGDHPLEVYTAILKEDLVSMLDHAADIGVELEKAYIALKEGKKYTQDRVDLEEDE
jgi:hypothetical protein|tara:strand:+ start:2213 stop:2656 length:444 start_codon:yes stop_codon:yes gene_type:complete